jgi:molecular chaperone GrpE
MSTKNRQPTDDREFDPPGRDDEAVADAGDTAEELNLDELANLAEQEAQAALREPGGAAAGSDDRLRAERDDLRDRLARVQADFANSRRRLESDFEQRMQYANSGLIKALLPVIDNFERALAVDATKTDAAAVLKGLQLVHDQMMDVLNKQHVEVIAPAAGEPFDPNRHEAVMQQPSAEHPDHSVLQTLQRGYALHGRTLRPASVIVSKEG